MLNQSTSRSYVSHVLIIAAAVLVFLGAYTLSRLLTSPQSAPVMTAENAVPGGTAVVNPPHQVQDFTLTSQTGEPVSLSDFRGKAVMLFFGYTNCPDVCPGTLAEYVAAKNALGTAAEDVAFVFISVDSQRDTPEVIGQYLAQFDASFVGLTADEDTLRTIGAEYGLMFEADTTTVAENHDHHGDHGQDHAHGTDVQSDNYFVQHTSPTFLIDPDGYLRLVHFVGTRGSVLAASAQQIMEEPVS